jgi:hypothetical protein
VRRWFGKSWLKDCGLTAVLVRILPDLRIGRDAGTTGVAVKCIDIGWNTNGEGRHLGFS